MQFVLIFYFIYLTLKLNARKKWILEYIIVAISSVLYILWLTYDKSLLNILFCVMFGVIFATTEIVITLNFSRNRRGLFVIIFWLALMSTGGLKGIMRSIEYFYQPAPINSQNIIFLENTTSTDYNQLQINNFRIGSINKIIEVNQGTPILVSQLKTVYDETVAEYFNNLIKEMDRYGYATIIYSGKNMIFISKERYGRVLKPGVLYANNINNLNNDELTPYQPYVSIGKNWYTSKKLIQRSTFNSISNAPLP